MGIGEKWCTLQRNQNVDTKMFFYKCFNEFKGDNVKVEIGEFSKLVKILGKAWNVSRTVPTKEHEKFAKHLYRSLESIKNGTYEFWNNEKACQFNNKKHAYSYESKVCFCINPKKYYLIYDSNNCIKLKKELKLKKKVTLEKFYKKAEEYINKLEEKPKTVEEFFGTDFDLWFKSE